MTPLDTCFYAFSFTTIASKLAPTVTRETDPPIGQ